MLLPTLALLVTWAVLGMWLRRLPARPRGAARARRLGRANLAVLVIALAAGFGSCAAPAALLAQSSREVAVLPPEDEADVLGERIDATRPLIDYALSSPFIIGGSIFGFERSGRAFHGPTT